jgi:hypothetical protein
MTKEPDRSYTQKSLAKKVLTAGAVLAVTVLSSVYNFGCGGKFYFPAGNCKNLKPILERQAEVARTTTPCNESAFVGLPIFMYDF